jgi:hypothetical protein
VAFASFLPTILELWHSASFFLQPAKDLNAKLKKVRQGLRNWSKSLSKLGKLIENCSWTLALLDGLEDQPSLCRLERNFRCLVRKHLLFLLEAKRTFWKQHSTARWVTLGDENTKFFHTLATRSFRRNYISQIRVDEDTVITDHDLIASVLYNAFKERIGVSDFVGISYDLHSNAFKERIGVSDFVGISYDLHSLIHTVDLPLLDGPFTDMDIQNDLKEMPLDHAPRPDGFNGLFIKSVGSKFFQSLDGFVMIFRRVQ